MKAALWLGLVMLAVGSLTFACIVWNSPQVLVVRMGQKCPKVHATFRHI